MSYFVMLYILTLFLFIVKLVNLFSRLFCYWMYYCGEMKIFDEARDDGVAPWQCISWTIMQIICALLQTDNHASTSSLNFTGWMLLLTHKEQCQSTEALCLPEFSEIPQTSYTSSRFDTRHLSF